MIRDFSTTCGKLTTATGGFSLSGGNLAFCGAILHKNQGGNPLKTDSLVYVLRKDGEAVNPAENPVGNGQQVVVNLLLQLRAFYQQNSVLIQNRNGLERQMSRQLQALTQGSGESPHTLVKMQNNLRKNGYLQTDAQQLVQTIEQMLKKK